MKLVIDIQEETYNKIRRGEPLYSADENVAIFAIETGTPLPKSHGRLIDADELKLAFIKWSVAVQGFFNDSDIASIVYASPTIIEADKEGDTE